MQELIKLLLQKDYLRGRKLILEHLRSNPKDVYLFYLCHMIEFNFGMTKLMLETLSIMQVFDGDMFYSYYLGIKAFILSENLNFALALSVGKKALSLNGKDVYALHALSHCYLDTKKIRQGKKFMQKHAFVWKNNYAMRLHLYWHYAFFALQQ